MTPPNATGAIIAAQFKKIVRSFHNHGAYSSGTAKTAEELGIRQNMIFNKLIRRGVILKSGSRKYFIDKDRLEQYSQMRRKIALLILLAIALPLLIAYFSGAFSN